MATFTLNNIFLCEVILLNDVITILGWTPLDLPVMISELFAMPLQVLLFEIEFGHLAFLICDVLHTFRKIFQKERVGHHDIASLLNTFGKDACGALCSYLLF